MENDTSNTVQSTSGNTGKGTRAYTFTWNNYTQENINELENFCRENCKDYVFQEEKGENGTPHLQGFWYFKNARSKKALIKIFPKVHIEIAKDYFAAKNYCKKNKTRNGKRIEKEEKKLKDPLEGKELKWWQSEILELLKTEPDDRKVYWYYDTEGGSGKTSLSKHICLNFPGESLYISGKANDIKYGISCFVDNKNNNLRNCIFDFTRSMENYISYQAIEEVKNGIFYNNKYESKMVLFNPPHIIIFANFEPDLSKLSKDRWVIKNINDKKSETPEVKKINNYDSFNDDLDDLDDLEVE